MKTVPVSQQSKITGEADTRDGPVPVIILAMLGLTPGLGIVFAAAALTWALVANRRGMLVTGVLAAVIGIANIVAVIAFSTGILRKQGGMVTVTVGSDLASVAAAIEKYREANGRYPAELAELRSPLNPFARVNLTDLAGGFSPRGPMYQYRLGADGDSYTVFSAGKDRTPGTDDDIMPTFAGGYPVAPGYRPPAPEARPPEEPK
ncbi:MAG: type II secretion system protein GspG [Gemmatimonadales bacterium]